MFLCGEGPKNFCISRELWRLEISAVEEHVLCGPTGEGPKSFSSPENYGDWRSARSRSSVLSVWKSTTVSGAFLGDDVAALAPSSGEDPTLPRHRAGAASRRVQLSRGLRGVDGDVRKRTRAPTDGNHLLLLLLLLKKSHHRLLTFTPLGAI